jgi:hypothetical protein
MRWQEGQRQFNGMGSRQFGVLLSEVIHPLDNEERL